MKSGLFKSEYAAHHLNQFDCCAHLSFLPSPLLIAILLIGKVLRNRLGSCNPDVGRRDGRGRSTTPATTRSASGGRSTPGRSTGTPDSGGRRSTTPEPPPVPPATYHWEEVRRQRTVGGYPWTHLNKPPFDENAWVKYERQVHHRQAADTAWRNVNYCRREKEGERGRDADWVNTDGSFCPKTIANYFLRLVANETVQSDENRRICCTI